MRRFNLYLIPLVAAFTAALFLTLSVSATTWDSSFQIATTAKYPATAIDSQGGMHFVWVNPDKDRMQYTHCTTARTCDAPETLPNPSGTPNHPALAINTQDQPVIVWEQHKGSTSTIYYSRRANGSWQTPLALSNQRQSVRPDVAIDSTDLAHVAYEAVLESGRAVYYVTTDGTVLRAPLLVETENIAATKITKGRNVSIAVNGDNLAHIVWNLATAPYGVKYTWQNPNGTFVYPKIVSEGQKDQTPDITIDRETNRVGIVWETRKNNRAAMMILENQVEVYRKYDVEGGLDIVRLPRIAVDCGGRMQIAFQRKKPGTGDWNIYARQFDPVTRNYTAPVVLPTTQQKSTTPALAANRFALITYLTGANGKMNAQRGNISGVCHGEPTPTPTYSASEHVPNLDPRIKYTQVWTTLYNVKASEENFARCGSTAKCKSGSSAKLAFVGGTRIEWETAYAKNFGKVLVLLDNKPFEVVDLCKPNKDSNAPRFAKRTYVLTGNASTPHSIEIRATGDTDCADSTSAYFVVDGFNIFP